MTDRPAIEVIGAFESTYLPAHDVDVLEVCGHVERRRDDLALLAASHVRRLRYPIRWHRVEAERGRYDWRATDLELAELREAGLRPIVDLVHHTSYPRWLAHGFADPRFGAAYLAYVTAVAERYPWIEEYTVFNEPFATLFLCGHEGAWYPFGRDMGTLVELFLNVLPSILEASRRLRAALPSARHVHVETCEDHSGTDDVGREAARLANDRRFFVTDLLAGVPLSAEGPFVRAVARAGGAALLDLEPGHVDVLGLDYYAHSEWSYSSAGAIAPSPSPRGLAALIGEYGARYDRRLMLTETNIRGTSADRATWLRHTLAECEAAVASGAPLEGYCWFPFVDSVDWDSLLRRHDRHIDPVGVYWLDERLERHASSMSRAYAAAAGGTPACELPAYRFSDQVKEYITPLLPRMADFPWQEPPTGVDEMTTFETVRAPRVRAG